MIVCYVDGGINNRSKKNSYYSFKIIVDNEVFCFSYKIHCLSKTNNEAEFQALLECLKFLKENNLNNITTIIFSDSKLIVNLINQKWKTNKTNLTFLLNEVYKSDIKYSLLWVKRDLIVKELGH